MLPTISHSLLALTSSQASYDRELNILPVKIWLERLGLGTPQ